MSSKQFEDNFPTIEIDCTNPRNHQANPIYWYEKSYKEIKMFLSDISFYVADYFTFMKKKRARAV